MKTYVINGIKIIAKNIGEAIYGYEIYSGLSYDGSVITSDDSNEGVIYEGIDSRLEISNWM